MSQILPAEPYHVFITGGSRGIGAAAVRAFAAKGYDVAFTWHTRADAAETVLRHRRGYAR